LGNLWEYLKENNQFRDERVRVINQQDASLVEVKSWLNNAFSLSFPVGRGGKPSENHRTKNLNEGFQVIYSGANTFLS
jgi:hypothetical protein